MNIQFLTYIEAHEALDVTKLNLAQLELLSDLIDFARTEVDQAIRQLKNKQNS